MLIIDIEDEEEDVVAVTKLDSSSDLDDDRSEKEDGNMQVIFGAVGEDISSSSQASALELSTD